MGQLDSHLKDLFDAATARLRFVTNRRMFGSQAWFVKDKIFALIWDGRAAVKLVSPEKYAELLATPGASAWSPMPRVKAMSAWVLLPESTHDDEEEMQRWLFEAHRGIEQLPPKPVKKKAPAKKKKARA